MKVSKVSTTLSNPEITKEFSDKLEKESFRLARAIFEFIDDRDEDPNIVINGLSFCLGSIAEHLEFSPTQFRTMMSAMFDNFKKGMTEKADANEKR